MKTLRNFTSNRTYVEILEARVAPAVLFIEANGTITNSSGTIANDTAAAALAQGGVTTQVTQAVDLHTGDMLVFDPLNTHTLSSKDTLLVNVTGGDAIAFFTHPSTAGSGFNA